MKSALHPVALLAALLAATLGLAQAAACLDYDIEDSTDLENWILDCPDGAPCLVKSGLETFPFQSVLWLGGNAHTLTSPLQHRVARMIAAC